VLQDGVQACMLSDVSDYSAAIYVPKIKIFVSLVWYTQHTVWYTQHTATQSVQFPSYLTKELYVTNSYNIKNSQFVYH
jgi:hypothetical protein